MLFAPQGLEQFKIRMLVSQYESRNPFKGVSKVVLWKWNWKFWGHFDTILVRLTKKRTEFLRRRNLSRYSISRFDFN